MIHETELSALMDVLDQDAHWAHLPNVEGWIYNIQGAAESVLTAGYRRREGTMTENKNLSDELRPTMPEEVLRAWALDAAAELRAANERIAALDQIIENVRSWSGGFRPSLIELERITNLAKEKK